MPCLRHYSILLFLQVSLPLKSKSTEKRKLKFQILLCFLDNISWNKFPEQYEIDQSRIDVN